MPGEAKDFGQVLPSLSATDLDWFLSNINPDFEKDRRDLVCLTVGVFLARRAKDLVRYNIEDVVAEGNGYWLRSWVTKTDRNGSRGPKDKYVEHLSDDRPCAPECPACALQAHLEVQLRNHGRSSGPLLRGVLTGERLTVMEVRNVIRRLWRQAGLDESALIGSRSLRVGGATSASEAGWDLADIAEQLTDHATLKNAAVYVRRLDPHSHQSALRL